MAIEAHKCNQPGCKGFVVFENADFDLKDIPTDDKYGCYAFDRPHCSECEKEFLVVPHYVVVDVKDKELGNFEQIESACYTEFEKRQKERKYDVETDPTQRIMNFLVQRNYTYAVHEVLAEYSRHQETGCYISHTMKDCLSHLKDEIKQLLASAGPEDRLPEGTKIRSREDGQIYTIYDSTRTNNQFGYGVYRYSVNERLNTGFALYKKWFEVIEDEGGE